MKISLCMITKDEEVFLSNCLESVKDYVDEIIIVDTGSKDNTCNIALNYKVKLYHQSWENDFSKPRNFGIEKATGDWILFLDADETLEHGNLLNALITNADNEIDGYLFNVLNYTDENLTQIEKSVSIRLFRNKPEIRFSGAIHEQLPIRDKLIAKTDLIIHHFGYIQSLNEKKNKSKRNLDILMNELRNNTEDGFIYYNLGCEYTRLYQFDSAITYFKEALIRIGDKTGYESRLYKMLAISLLSTKNWDDCLKTIEKGIEKYPNYPDLYFIRGLYYKVTDNYSMAIANFEKCLLLDNQHYNENEIYVLEEGVTNYKAYYHLGRIYEKINNYQESLAAYAKALKIKPHYKEPLLRLIKLFEIDTKELITFFETKVFEKIEDHLIYSKIFYEIKKYEISLALLKNNKNQIFKKNINFSDELVPYLACSYWITNDMQKARQLLLDSQYPSKNYIKAIEIFLRFGEEKILEGTNNYPDCIALEENIKSISKLIKAVQMY